MGAVRIYKKPNAYYLQINDWQIRSDGCTVEDAGECDYGRKHEGLCDGYFKFEYVIKHLNDPLTELGAYLNK